MVSPLYNTQAVVPVAEYNDVPENAGQATQIS
jgi:hypothetical protein